MDSAPICPSCGKDLFEHYRTDGVRRWRCLCSSASYSEREYIIRPGEMPVRVRTREINLGNGEVVRFGVVGGGHDRR